MAPATHLCMLECLFKVLQVSFVSSHKMKISHISGHGGKSMRHFQLRSGKRSVAPRNFVHYVLST